MHNPQSIYERWNASLAHTQWGRQHAVELATVQNGGGRMNERGTVNVDDTRRHPHANDWRPEHNRWTKNVKWMNEGGAFVQTNLSVRHEDGESRTFHLVGVLRSSFSTCLPVIRHAFQGLDVGVRNARPWFHIWIIFEDVLSIVVEILWPFLPSLVKFDAHLSSPVVWRSRTEVVAYCLKYRDWSLCRCLDACARGHYRILAGS